MHCTGLRLVDIVLGKFIYNNNFLNKLYLAQLLIIPLKNKKKTRMETIQILSHFIIY